MRNSFAMIALSAFAVWGANAQADNNSRKIPATTQEQYREIQNNMENIANSQEIGAENTKELQNLIIKLQKEHKELLKEHKKILDQQKQILDEHQKIMNEHKKLMKNSAPSNHIF